MQRAKYILFMLIIVLSGLWFSRKNLYQWVVTSHSNKAIPDAELKLLSGETVRLQGYLGKVLVLDFWTTWCGKCKQAFPDFQSLATKYERNNNVVFLAVNTSQGGDSFDKTSSFMRNHGFMFQAAYDSTAVLSNRLDIKYYPTLIIVDPAGRIRLRHIGYSKSFEDYRVLVNHHLEKLLAESN